MKQHYITILLATLFLPVSLTAQQQAASSTFTLVQCIQYAMENSINLTNSGLDEQIASARVKEIFGQGLPQLNGSVGLQYNPQLPRLFFLKSRAYGFSSAAVQGSPNYVPYDQYLPNLKNNDVVSSPNLFQLQGTGNASVSITQMIFNGSYFVGLQAAKTYKELSVRTTVQTREQVVEQVTKAYYSALINRERMKLFDNNIDRVDSLFKNTKALNVNGFAETIDVDRIEVSLNNLITERNKFMKLQELSVELLKFQMNYPMDQTLQVSGDITQETVSVDLDGYLKDWNYKNRPDYQVLETNLKLQSLNVKNRYAASMPSLNASANVGYITGSNSISGLFKTNSNISSSDQQKYGIGTDKWYPVSSYGLTFSLPIFSGFQRTYQVQQEKLRLRKVENSLKALKSGIDYEVKQATISYQNAMDALQVQQRNMTLAQKVAKVTKIKYEQGVGSNIEVVDAESSLKESQVNYYNAMFDAIVAKTDLDKAFGKLISTK